MSNKIIKIFALSIILFCPLLIFAKSSKTKKIIKITRSSYQNELLVIGALKNLYAAQANYFSNVGNRKFGGFVELRKAGLIDESLASGVKFGYIFSLQASTNTFEPAFVVSAKPKAYRKTGKRSFYFDARCEIRGADKNGGNADSNDALVSTCVPTIAYENEAAAILNVRTLASAQETYKATVGNGNYGSFQDLYEAGLIPAELRTGFFKNYYYQYLITAPIPENQIPSTFKIYVNPYLYGQMGFRSFFTNQSQIIRGADHQGQNGNENDPPIQN